MSSFRISRKKGALIIAVATTVALLLALAPAPPAAAAGSWSSTRDVVPSTFNGVYFLDATHGYAVGSPDFDFHSYLHNTWYTDDGGDTWTGQTIENWSSYPSLLGAEMNGVHFLDANNGYVVGQYGLIIRYTTQWDVVRPDGTANEVLYDVVVQDATTATVVGVEIGSPPTDVNQWTPIVLRTVDGGANWASVDLNDTFFANTADGWAVGDGGTIIHTADGGTNWSLQTSGTTDDLNAVYALDANNAWAAGDNGSLLYTTDAGTTWRSDFDANSVHSIDDAHTWVVGDDGLILFYDGTDWEDQTDHTVTGEDLNAVHFSEDGGTYYGWAVGENNTLVYSDDDGATWTAYSDVATDYNGVHTIIDSGNLYVWAVGDGGTVSYQDYGLGVGPGAWSTPTTAPTSDLYGVEFTDTTSGYVAGSLEVSYTTDGGDNWTNIACAANFKDVTYGGTGSNWFAVGENGQIWQTRDGANWGPMDLYGVSAPDSTAVYYTGGGGAILKQEPAGWSVMDSGHSHDLYGVEFTDASSGWAAGEQDIVEYTTDGSTWNDASTAAGAEWRGVSVFDDSGTYYICVVGKDGDIMHNTYTAPGPPSGWQAPTAKPSGTPDLYAVDFMTADIGWAVGEDGTVWQTTDGTATNPTWTEVHLNDVYSFSASDTWFVGEGGTVLHYDGTDFEMHYTTSWTTEDLNAVHFDFASGNGWAVGDNGTAIWYEAGTGWHDADTIPGMAPNEVNDVFMMSEDSGIAVAQGGYYSELSGGAWGAAAQVAPTGTNPDLYGVFMDVGGGGTDGIAVGGDGMGTGYYVDVDLTNSPPAPDWTVTAAGTVDWQGVYLSDPTDGDESGYAVGPDGWYLRWSDGAQDAPAQADPGGTNYDLYDVYLSADDTGRAVGGDGTQGYSVEITTTPPYVSSTYEPVDNSSTLTGIGSYPASDNFFCSALDRGAFFYDYSGDNWSTLSSFTDVISASDDFRGFDLAPGGLDAGWAVGTGGTAYEFQGGALRVSTSGSTEDLEGVCTRDAGNAWAVGSAGTVLYHNGSTWASQTSDTGRALYGVDFYDSSNGRAAGAGRTVISTSNGGSDWSQVSGVEAENLYGTSFTSVDDGWICGAGGLLYRYEDGIIYDLESNTTDDLHGISVYGAGGFAVGAARRVIESDDGGDTWSDLSYMENTNGLYGASFTGSAGDCQGWFSGTGGTVVHYDNGAFETQDPGTTSNLMDVSFVDNGSNDRGIAVGEDAAAVYTTNNGADWSNAVFDTAPSGNVNGVEIVSLTKGVMCGDSGEVWYADGSVGSWTAPTTQPPATTEDFNGVAIGGATNDDAWAVADGGVVYTASNPYETWTLQASGTTQDLRRVSAAYDGVSDYTCFAVGDVRTIINTTDSGTNWATQSGPPGKSGLFGIDIETVTTGYPFACGFGLTGGYVLTSKDAYATFDVEYPGGAGSTVPLYSIDCYDNSNIWTVGGTAGQYAIYHGDTANAWAAQAGGAGDELYGVYSDYNGSSSNYEIVAVGQNGAILYSTNGGATWNPPANDAYNRTDLNAVWYTNTGVATGDGYAVGGVLDDVEDVHAGNIIETSDRGDTWSFSLGPGNDLEDTGFYNASDGWAVGDRGTIIFTGTGGTDWTPQDSGTDADLKAISVLDASNAWVAGVSSDGADGIVLNWNGAAWSTLNTFVGTPLYGVYSDDSGNIWVVGESGAIHYYDGSWEDQSVATSETLYDVEGVDANPVWAVGGAGEAYVFDGANWSADPTGVGTDLYGVCATDATHVWAVGDSGQITFNDGSSWSSQTPPSNVVMYDVRFGDRANPDVRNGWIVGDPDPLTGQHGAIFETTDGGDNWSAVDSGTKLSIALKGLDLAWDTNKWVGYAAGDWGFVQEMTAGMGRPTITPPLTPPQGTIGTTVTIDGTDFGADQATVNGKVYFAGGIDAGAAATWNNTQIVIDVPSGAYTGNIHVVNDGGSSNGVLFTVIPDITDVTPTPMTGGDTVTITGEGFGDAPDPGDGVDIGATTIDGGDVTSWTNTEIQLDLPNDADPGTGLDVTVTAGGNVSAAFSPVELRPTITNITYETPAGGARTGEEVTITGTNFGPDPGVGSRSTATHNVTISTSTAPQMIPDSDVTVWDEQPAESTITFTVPYTATTFEPRTGAIQLTANSATDADLLTILSKIDSVVPATGNTGIAVTITGTCFGDTQLQLDGHAYFGGSEATATSWADDSIDVTVPADAATGDVIVTTEGNDSNAGAFNVEPTLGSLGTTQGRVGDSLELIGTGFGPVQGAGTVTINGVDATVTSWNSTTIEVTVPEEATSGDVVVTTAGGDTGAIGYTVMPRITTVTPERGVPNETLVTIDGYTFGDAQGVSQVQFSGVSAGNAASWSRNQIKIKVPDNATSGEIIVITPNGMSNGHYFSVGPFIGGIQPDNGPPGIEVKITGENFQGYQGSSTVTFNGVDAGEANSWSDTEIKVNVPQGATTGPVIVTTPDGASNAVDFTVGLANTFYFAEGTTRAGFEQYLCLMNPNAEEANVNITYMLGDGTTMPQLVTIDPTTRTTIFVPDAVGPEKDVSTRIESDQPIVAERPMYFSYHGLWNGGHDVVGAVAPDTHWYFAEGTTRDGFDTWLCIQNPNQTAASVDITYMLGDGTTQVQELNIGATTRETIDVKAAVGPNRDVSAHVSSDIGVIAERPMYFNYKGAWTGGHDVLGANAPASDWYFAEGTTREGFDEWLCIQNPGANETLVYITYMLGTGQNVTDVVSVDAQSRKTISPTDFLGRGYDVSMKLTSTQPIVAERPMYFDYVGITGGHDVVGATGPAREWYFAEGATQNGFQEWLSIQNPSERGAEVTVTYMLGTGETMEQVVVIDPKTRATVDVNGFVGWGQDVSARVTSPVDIIVERPMYFVYNGWCPGGHDVVGFSW